VDLLFDEGRGLRLNASAFNNEFFAKACQEWRERLVRGDFAPEAIQKNRSDYDSDRRRLDPWKVRHFEPLWGLKRVYDLNNIIPEVGELDWVDRVNKVESGSATSCSQSSEQSDNKVEGDMCVDSPTVDSASKNSIETNKPVLGKRMKIEEDPPVSSSVSPGGEKCRQTLMVSPTKSPRVTVTDTTEEITDLLLVSGEPSAAKRRRLDLAEAEPSVTTAEEPGIPTVEESKVRAVDNLARGSEPIVPSSEESACTVLDSGREGEMDSLINETEETESSKNKEGVVKIEENKGSPLLVEDKTEENSSEEGNGGGELGCDTRADKEINLMDTGTGSKELLQNNDSDDSDNKRGNEVASCESMLEQEETETKEDGLHQLPINVSLSAETSEHGLASVDTDPENCDKPEGIPVLPLSPASANPSSPSQSAYSPKQINSRQSSSEDSIPAPVLTSEEPLCMMFDIEDRAPSSMESTLPPTLSPNCEPEMLDVEEDETDSMEKVAECVEAVSPEQEDRVQSPPLEEEVGSVGEKQDISLGRSDMALTDEQVDEKKPSVTVAAFEISEGSYGDLAAEEGSSCSDYEEAEDIGESSPAQQQVLNGPEEEESHAIASDSRCDSSRSGSSVSVAAGGTLAEDESENIGETETEEGKETEVAGGGERNSCETVSEAGEGVNETTAGTVAEGVCHQVQSETSPIFGSESPAAAAAATAAAATAATEAAAVPAVLLTDAENVSSQDSSHNDGVGSLSSSITEDGSCPAAKFAEDGSCPAASFVEDGSQPSEPANGVISLNSRPSVSLTFYLF
jgi:hypothetical protein